jgi:hypothetical protein
MAVRTLANGNPCGRQPRWTRNLRAERRNDFTPAFSAPGCRPSEFLDASMPRVAPSRSMALGNDLTSRGAR